MKLVAAVSLGNASAARLVNSIGMRCFNGSRPWCHIRDLKQTRMSIGGPRSTALPKRSPSTVSAGRAYCSSHRCPTCAAARHRVPSRCGICPPPTASQGRAGANLIDARKRHHRSAHRALALALTAVGYSSFPHGRHRLHAAPFSRASICHRSNIYAMIPPGEAGWA